MLALIQVFLSGTCPCRLRGVALAGIIRAMNNISIKTPEQIEAMRVSGKLGAEVLDFIAPYVQPGVTTNELDKLCHDYMVDVQGTIPAPLNYAPEGHTPYPKSVCTSVNHQVCHGIPNDKPLKKGDIVNIDVTPITNGWHGDSSRMFIVGGEDTAPPFVRRLCRVTYESMWKGIVEVKPGARLGDIGSAIQKYVEGHGYSVVREFCGHGVGRDFHTDPQVLHYGRPGTMEELVPGMIFTIEPRVNAGRREIKEGPDGWAIVTKDRSLSAQWEHAVVVTPTGYEVLTLSPGMPALPDFVHATAT